VVSSLLHSSWMLTLFHTCMTAIASRFSIIPPSLLHALLPAAVVDLQVKGRVALLGDAAHLGTPVLGQVGGSGVEGGPSCMPGPC
jgi:hypothetical protein